MPIYGCARVKHQAKVRDAMNYYHVGHRRATTVISRGHSVQSIHFLPDISSPPISQPYA